MDALVGRLVALGYVQLDEVNWDILLGQKNDSVAVERAYSDDYHLVLEVLADNLAVAVGSMAFAVADIAAEGLRSRRDRDHLVVDSRLFRHQDPCHGCSCHCVVNGMTPVSSVACQGGEALLAYPNSSVTC